MRKSFLVAGVATLALAISGAAVAQEPTSTVSVKLSPKKAGTTKKPKATKLTLNIDNNATTQTASQLKITAPKGVTLTTKDFKKCNVDKLANEGPSACPKDSQIGPTREANALAGVSGTSPSPATFDVTPYATGSKSIAFFLQLEGGGAITGVATGKISGRSLTVSIPKNPAQELPAGVYNGLVDIEAELWVKRGKSVVKLTDCPRNKKLRFKNTITFVNNPNPPAVKTHTATSDARCS